MRKKLKTVTFEDTCARGREICDALAEDADYQALTARAEALGVTVAVSVRHTYTDELRASYCIPDEMTGRVPYGYAMELWFDLVRGGKILAGGDATESRVQYSCSAVAIEQRNGFFRAFLVFLSYKEIIARSQPLAMLGEFLDEIEAHGAVPSPFSADSLYPVTAPDRFALLRRDEVEEGSYVELLPAAYDGGVGHEDARYLPTAVFFPFKLLLTDIAEGGADDPYLTLSPDALAAFSGRVDELPYALRGEKSFSDVLSEKYEISAFSPPPRAEELLNHITLTRREEFLGLCDALSDFLHTAANADNPVTLIW